LLYQATVLPTSAYTAAFTTGGGQGGVSLAPSLRANAHSAVNAHTAGLLQVLADNPLGLSW
jgi:hypothetical protein